MSTLKVKGISAPTGYDLQMPAGATLQVLQHHNTNSSLVETTSTSYVATGLTKTITPKFATSKIKVEFSCYCDAAATGYSVFLTVKRGSTNLGGGARSGFIGTDTVSNGRILTGLNYSYLDSPSTTSAITYEVYMKCGGSSQTVRLRTDENPATLILTEIAG